MMYDAYMIKIPTDMDVPEIRRDTSKPENVKWLLRNLLVRNFNHPELNRVIAELKTKQIKEKI